MMGHRRSQFTSKLPLLLMIVCCAALIRCVQLDGDTGATGVPGDVGSEKAWGQAERISDLSAAPNVALDSDGNGIVVWMQLKVDSSGSELWARTYADGGEWAPPERVGETEVNRTGAPALAADPDGNAVVIWDQTDSTRYDLWSNRYAPDEGWSTPQRIERDDAGDTFRPQVAMDPSGNAVAVWQQFDGVRDNIWANRYTPSDEWGLAERIEANNNAGGARNAQIALDSSGNAIAVWQQSDGVRDNIWANRFTPRRGWGGAERIEVDNAGEAVAPHVAADPDGNAVVVWQQFDGTHYNIASNRYVHDEGWGAAKRIETGDAGNAEHPRVAMGAQGSAVAVWDQFDGMTFDIWSNRYAPNIGWGTAERIEYYDAGEASHPRVVVDPEGNAVVGWYQHDGERDRIWSNRYTPSGGWGIAQPIDGHTDGLNGHPKLAIAPNGDAMAVWNVALIWNDPNHGTWVNRLE